MEKVGRLLYRWGVAGLPSSSQQRPDGGVATLGRLWLDALQFADTMQREPTCAAVERARQASGEATYFEASAARILLLVGDYHGALNAAELAERAATTADERQDAAWARGLVLGMLGDFEQAIAVLQGLVTPNTPPSLLLAASELCAAVADRERVLSWSKLLATHPTVTVEQLLCLADLLHRVDADATAVAVLLGVLDHRDASDAARHRGARLLLACRAGEQASVEFRRQLEAGIEVAAAHLALATIHLWLAQTAEAASHANLAIEHDGDVHAARRVLAATTLLEGHASKALAQLDELLLQTPRDVEARVWRMEALLRSHQPRRVLDEIRPVGDLSLDASNYSAIHILGALASLALHRRPDGNLMVTRTVAVVCGEDMGKRVRKLMRRIIAPGRGLVADRILVAVCSRLRAVGVPVPEVDHPQVVESILEKTLTALGGNRTYATPTWIDHGKLAPLIVAPPPRSEVRDALHAVRVGGFEEAHQRLQILKQRYPRWPHPWFYHAELLMWVGRLDEARSDLEHALGMWMIDREIERGYWPLVGLAGVHVLQGRPQQALRTIQRAARRFGGSPAQPYYAWLGEILRALGRLDEARAALEQACPATGARLGSWITLALTCRDLGDRERSRQVVGLLVDQAPALMIDLTRTADRESLRAILDGPAALARLGDNEVRELLERAQRAMHGNRSTCVTFVDSTGRLRAIPPGGVYHFVDGRSEREELRDRLKHQ